MPRRLPEDFVVAVFDALGAVLPDGVYLVKRGDSCTVRASGVSLSRGLSAALPPFATNDELAVQFGVRPLVEQLCQQVAEALDEPWPAPGAKTQVSVKETVRIWFGAGRWDDAVLRLPEIAWSGPLSERGSPTRSPGDDEPHYAGHLSDEQRALDAERRRKNREERQIAAAALAALRERAPGLDRGQLRQVAHEEFTARGLDLPQSVNGPIGASGGDVG